MSPQMINVAQIPLPTVKLAEDDLLMVDHIQTTVQIHLHTVTHMFVVVNTLNQYTSYSWNGFLTTTTWHGD